MQVQVTCTLNLIHAMPDVNRLEEAVFDLGLKVMAELMARALAALDERSEKVCANCSGRDFAADGTAPHRLRTRFGTVPIKRRQYHCKGCDQSFRPLDRVLSTAGAGRTTQALLELAVLAAASWPFATAAMVIHRLCGAKVSPKWGKASSRIRRQGPGGASQGARPFGY